MNLKDNKGFVGVDASLAVVIFLILVPTIFGIVYSINSNKNESNIKSVALNIAVNSIECAKTIDLEKSDAENAEAILNDLKTNIYNDKITINSDKKSAVITNDIASYKLEIQVTDYKGDNIVKTVKAIVTYKFKGQEKTIDLSSVIK